MSVDYLTLIQHQFRYHPGTGRIHWQPHIRRGVRIYLSKCPSNNHLVIVGPNRYLAQNVVWFLVHGTWPERPLRHRNGHWWDNRIENLEMVPRAD